MSRHLFIITLLLLSNPSGVLAGWAPPPPVVVAATVKQQEIEEGLNVPGSFYAVEDVIIRAKTNGEIKEICFHDGSSVKRGDVLFRIDNKEKKAALQRIQADLKLYAGQHKRAKELFDREFLSQSNLDKADANLAQAKASFAIATEELEKTEVKAPFDGVLSTREVSVGAYVQNYDPLVRLQSVAPIRFEFQVPATKIALLKKGQAINITTDVFPNKSFSGQIIIIEPRADEKTRNVKVVAELPNTDTQLMAGMYGNATVTTADKHMALVIPEEALVVRRDGLYAYKIEKDDTKTEAQANNEDGVVPASATEETPKTKATLVKINIGTRSKDLVEIISGLGQGDQIVLQGQDKIQDGTDIEVDKPQG